jgi:hypothetical protein
MSSTGEGNFYKWTLKMNQPQLIDRVALNFV